MLLMMVTYFAWYTTLSILRHTTFHSYGSDLGLFDQIFWNTVHGHFFESTMSLGQTHPHSYFSDHFSPVFLLVVPFYWLFPHPATLLVAQTLALALGAAPIYLLARLHFAPGLTRVGWVAVYFLFLPVAFINLFDFHELPFAVAPLGFAIYCLERKWTGWFLASLLVALSVKEELPLTGLGFGVYILASKRDVRLGLLTLALSGLAFFAIIRLIIPAFGGGSGYAYFATRYGQLGDSPLHMVENVIAQPGRLFGTLLQVQKAKFVFTIFGPVLGLALLSGWGIFLVLPTLGVLLLSNYQPQFAFTSHYAAPLIALVLGSSIIGLARLRASVHAPVTAMVLLSSLAFSLLLGDLPFSRHFQPSMFQTEARYTEFAGKLALIPAGASVAAENNLTPQLSHRRLLYDLEFEGPAGAQYVALDGAALNRSPTAFRQQLASFQSRGYEVLASGDQLALLRRR